MASALSPLILVYRSRRTIWEKPMLAGSSIPTPDLPEYQVSKFIWSPLRRSLKISTCLSAAAWAAAICSSVVWALVILGAMK